MSEAKTLARIREFEEALTRIGRRSCHFDPVVCPERVPNEKDFWCAPCIARAALARRLRALELVVEATREAADLLGIIASYVESDDDVGIGQIKWARDARRVETALRAAIGEEKSDG